MATKSRLFSLDNECDDYLNTIPKQKRSETVREALKLHKFKHREEKTTENPRLKVKIIG